MSIFINEKLHEKDMQIKSFNKEARRDRKQIPTAN
jgi:hypothetical protein